MQLPHARLPRFLPVRTAIASTTLAAVGASHAAAHDSHFETSYVLPLPGYAGPVRAADLDGDGREDVVVADSDGLRLLVLRNTGPGYGVQTTIPLAAPAGAFRLADLDGDGDLDVAMPNTFTDTVTFARNDGAWSFTTLPAIPVPARPWTVDSADLDADGLAEVVIVHQQLGTTTISVLHNLGGMSFAAPTTTATTAGSAVGALADLDGDGDLDLLLSAGVVSWNAGGGAFGPGQAIATGASSYGAVPVDLDGDGDPDIIEGSTTGYVRTIRNQGGGSFALIGQVLVHPGSVTPAAADMDGDGDPDALAILSTGLTVLVVNSGGGALGGVSVLSTGAHTYFLAASDQDLDGDLDLVAVSFGDTGTGTGFGALTLLWNAGDGTAPGAAQEAAGSGSTSIASGDLDGVNGTDVVVANRNVNSVSVCLALGDGTFAPQVVYGAGASPKDIAIGDVDLDGDLDVVAASTQVQVLKNLGAGVLAAAVAYPAGTLPSDVAIGDLTGDGLPDLAVSNFTSNNVSVLVNQGGGVFGAPVHYAAGSSAAAVTIADLDGDGDRDLAVANGFSDDVSVLLNLGNGTFAGQVRYPTAMSPSDVRAADFDLDGDLDLAVACNDGFVSVLSNLGNGTFAPQVAVPAGDYPVRLAVADFDLDGDPDLGVSNYVGVKHGARVLWNSGAGGFTDSEELVGDLSAYGVDAADLDQDGDSDLALVRFNGSAWVWYRNTTVVGRVLCAGDGSGTACPCGNASAPGAGAGCLHSFGDAGRLRSTGSASLAHDTLALVGTHMPPTATALYFQGTSASAGGAGAVFGDGLRCAAGSVARLGTRVNSGGASQVPAPGDPPLRVRGMVNAPGVRVYQAWYRNAASFCSADAFNLTNGVRVRWAP